MTDAELTQTPGPLDPGSRAWLDLSVHVGDLTSELKAARQIRGATSRPLRHVATGSAVVPASGTVVIDVGGPAAGREWNVRRLHVFDTADELGASCATTTFASGTFPAAAAGNITLPAGAKLTGFDVTLAPAAAVVSGLVTVTGVGFENLNYWLSELTTGTTLSVRIPGGAAASSATATPSVNVPAITGGAEYAIAVYGTTDDTPGSGAWYLGTPGQYASTTDHWPITSVPDALRVGTDQLLVTGRDRLFAVINGATPGHNIVARAAVLDYPTGSGRSTDPL